MGGLSTKIPMKCRAVPYGRMERHHHAPITFHRMQECVVHEPPLLKRRCLIDAQYHHPHRNGHSEKRALRVAPTLSEHRPHEHEPHSSLDKVRELLPITKLIFTPC